MTGVVTGAIVGAVDSIVPIPGEAVTWYEADDTAHSTAPAWYEADGTKHTTTATWLEADDTSHTWN